MPSLALPPEAKVLERFRPAFTAPTYDRFVVPVTRVVERRITPPFGQSVLGVAVVPG